MKENPIFHDEVKMWVFEEIINGRKLTEIINQDHENTKYLPGFKIPNNVVSELISSMICLNFSACK